MTISLPCCVFLLVLAIILLTNNVSGNEDNELYFVGYSKNVFDLPTFSKNSSVGRNIKQLQDIGSEGSNRYKRGVTQLYNIISCATGCNPLSYKGYGCYCGFLGAGRVTDSIDRCCKLHDLCYNTVNCPIFSTYLVPYLWKCWRGRPLCAIDHLEYGRPGSCAARLCECDRQLAMCLSYSPCPRRRALCTSSPFRLLQNIILL